MIHTERQTLHWFLLTNPDPQTFAELLATFQMMRRLKTEWPPETPAELRRQLAALVKAGLVAWNLDDKGVVEAVCVAEREPQGSFLF